MANIRVNDSWLLAEMVDCQSVGEKSGVSQAIQHFPWGADNNYVELSMP